MRSGSGRGGAAARRPAPVTAAPARGRALIIVTLALALLVPLVLAGSAAAEGPVIDKIRFTGNEHVPADTLLARMETAESGFLKHRRLDSYTFGQDLVNLEFYYQNVGFLTAEVRAGDLDYNRDSSHVSLNIRVKEGPQWLVQDVIFQGNSLIPTEDLARVVGLKTESAFSPSQVLIGRDNLLDYYVSRSFLDARVESDMVRDDPNHRANVTYRIFEGPIATIGDVEITGLVKTDTSVVRRELTLKRGNRIRVKDVARSQSNLYTTGLFRSVYIAPDTSSAGDSVKTVTVSLVERRTGQLSFGAGFGTEDHFRLTTELRHRNLLGQNLEAGLEGTLSRRRRELNVAFSQPWSFGLRLKVTERAGYRYINKVGFTSDGVRFGGSLLRPIYPYWRVEGGYDWSRDVIVEGPDTLITRNTVRVSRLFTQGTYETRDDLLNTYHGYYANLMLEAAGAFLGGTANFLRGTTDQRFFRKIGDTVIGLHLGTGAMRQQSASEPIPITERFFLGGQGTVRGFPEDRLGPKDEEGQPIGGLERVFLQTEARIPLFWILGSVAFVDAGMISDRPPGISFGQLAAGAGIGLRVRSPIGIIRLDAGAPLTKKDAQGVQFTFGTSQEF